MPEEYTAPYGLLLARLGEAGESTHHRHYLLSGEYRTSVVSYLTMLEIGSYGNREVERTEYAVLTELPSAKEFHLSAQTMDTLCHLWLSRHHEEATAPEETGKEAHA